eukprot:2141661-Lingulodinium_polyedra.AAC.1
MREASRTKTSSPHGVEIGARNITHNAVTADRPWNRKDPVACLPHEPVGMLEDAQTRAPNEGDP